MINKLYFYNSIGLNPYENLATEEYFLDNLPPNSCILYLWQNKHTVVIGKNQNAWAECKVNKLEEDNGYLARRLSGGGAVFHDLGNLNFTFIMPTEDYDISKQLEVISKAISSFGITVEKSGRNDLTVDGKKFSGNAFCKKTNNAYHHGTILIDVDMKNIGKYLNVSQQKLKSNGVSSVRSRVANLKEFSSEISIENAKTRLEDAFQEVYNLKAEKINNNFINKEKIEIIKEKYASWEWRLGKNIHFDTVLSNKFSWGQVNIDLSIQSGIIKDANIFSDAMDCDSLELIVPKLLGMKYDETKVFEIIDDTMKKSDCTMFK